MRTTRHLPFIYANCRWLTVEDSLCSQNSKIEKMESVSLTLLSILNDVFTSMFNELNRFGLNLFLYK